MYIRAQAHEGNISMHMHSFYYYPYHISIISPNNTNFYNKLAARANSKKYYASVVVV